MENQNNSNWMKVKKQQLKNTSLKKKNIDVNGNLKIKLHREFKI